MKCLSLTLDLLNQKLKDEAQLPVFYPALHVILVLIQVQESLN
jgi:hypothetical protein